MRELFIQATYLAASILFILGLKSLTTPASARRGMQQAMVGMLLAIVGTLLHHEIVSFRWIAVGLILGTAIAVPFASRASMTQMPQLIAISHMFGAIAATLVGVVEYHLHGAALGVPKTIAVGIEVLFGALTTTGSFMAFGKLQGIVTERPLTYRGQNAINLSLCVLTLGFFGYLLYDGSVAPLFYGMLALAALLGVLMVVPIGGADMPVIVSLLNSYAGIASAATGFAIDNNVLIIAGALNGASGFMLSLLMSKAMNRSFANILFGAFGGAAPAAGGPGTAGLTVRSVTPEDAAIQLAYARSVIIVPGYGMAVAQAQHQVRELAELIERKGGEVRYAIHPVAGRMPGHLNVILSDAQVPYDALITDVDDANAALARADIALVIGANDIVNPAAKDEPGSPIYGMPIIDVRQAHTVMVMKRSMASGFAGIENPLFYLDNTRMLFGDARTSLKSLVMEIKAMDEASAF